MADTNTNRVTLVKDVVKKLIASSFPSTLGREPDILNIVSALIYKESSFNVNAVGKQVSRGPYTGGGAFLSSSAIRALLTDPGSTSTQINNVYTGLTAVGLMQVMGHYFIRGGSPSGQTELQRSRPDLAAGLLVNPGDNIYTSILGEANIEKAITAGLIILESKYRLISTGDNYFYVKGDKYQRRFTTKLQGAVSAYLGLGAVDANGTAPEQYAATIMGGSSYVAANGKGSLKIRDSEIRTASSNGPSTNGSTLASISVPGCIATTG
jgi:hypothetical protein